MSTAAKILLTEGDAPATPASGQVALYPKTDHQLYMKTSAGTETNIAPPVKASGSELDTGTDDAKFSTAKALKDSHNVPSVVPGTSGNVLTSNGTDWTSTTPASGVAVADIGSTAETVGGSVANGSAATAARSDHKHAITNPAIDTLAAATDITTRDASTTAHGLVVKCVAPAAGLTNVVAIENGETVYKNKALFDATNPSTQAFSDSAAVGTAVVAARRDHKHAMPASPSVPDMTAPGTIGGTTPGIVYSVNAEIFKTASADSPLTALQVSGTIVSNYGMTDADCVISLPTAASGYSFVAILPAVRARYFKFRAGSTDKIYLLGVAGSDNAYVGVASGYATGASCSFFTFKASDGGFDWFAIPIFGTWVAS